jgi:hypothetical protein
VSNLTVHESASGAPPYTIARPNLILVRLGRTGERFED